MVRVPKLQLVRVYDWTPQKNLFPRIPRKNTNSTEKSAAAELWIPGGTDLGTSLKISEICILDAYTIIFLLGAQPHHSAAETLLNLCGKSLSPLWIVLHVVPTHQGYILDGFPKTMEQAQQLFGRTSKFELLVFLGTCDNRCLPFKF